MTISSFTQANGGDEVVRCAMLSLIWRKGETLQTEGNLKVEGLSDLNWTKGSKNFETTLGRDGVGGS
ncbi:hypothetical protein BCON_0210g00130 [Botryotinia convoluta]|uniref:Uncharacterized protein n=1 Tax=Botryotinia convoluta TaxID=54673 RepID=A0A4Z1HQ44_9HELO|nr:hypothetical protein BCON_0210g00130 [Botryotinia convoluta]